MALATLAFLLAAQPQQPKFFPFVIPWDDSVRGTATDVSFLNAKPAGKNGWIAARNGVLVESKTGKRVKFLGTNFTTRAAFPSHADADKVAARLAKLGFNIVRFHHLQNSWDKEKGMIWKQGREMIEIDPKQLDRIDYLVAALKKQGIYSNINLQTTRDYLPEMGFPESVKQLPWGFAKRIDKYDRKMIALQKAYAKALIGRVNKYTGLKYTADPAIMVVEINNENSLVGAPWETLGGGFEAVPEPFKGNLRKLWNDWLAKRYGSERQMLDSWSRSDTPRGPNMLSDFKRWAIEQHDGSVVSGRGEFVNGVGKFEAEITKAQGAEWSVQANVPGLDLLNGNTYTFQFTARADRKMNVLVHAGADTGDYHNIGLTQRVEVGPTPQTFRMSFKADNVIPNHTRVGFFLGSSIGKIAVEGVQLSPGAVPPGLEPGEGLGQRNIAIPGPQASEVQRLDFMRFLTDAESAYSLEMRNFLKKDLGYKGIVYDTQISWGGLTGLVREAPMEVADNHSYYHHPEFPGSGWDEENWIVKNSPMVGDMGARKYGELGGLAQYRVFGKPYSISEYNHPAPMDDRAEMMPLLSSFAAVQDWDVLYSFDYGSYGSGEPNNRVQGFFGIGSDPAKSAFYPAAAQIFRNNLIPRATALTILNLPATPYEDAKTAYGAWAQAGGIPDLFRRRIAIRRTGSRKASLTVSGSESSPTVYLTNMKRGNIYKADAPGVKLASGFVGKNILTFKDATFSFPERGRDLLTMVLSAQDGLATSKSKRMLLTLVGRIENRNMGWNEQRTSVGKRWGEGPTQAEFIPVTVTLRTSLRNAWALDGNGRRAHKLPTRWANGKLTFTTSPSQPSIWYEIS